MDNKTRRTRFESRIKIEREFLSAINAVFGQDCPLSGMTIDAINQWEKLAYANAQDQNIEGIANLLREASARAELMADDSKDVFEPDRRELNSLASVHDLLVEELSLFSTEAVEKV